jgi:hypothetical protein
MSAVAAFVKAQDGPAPRDNPYLFEAPPDIVACSGLRTRVRRDGRTASVGLHLEWGH